jgi:tripartite-type tricarboxylate transporter receptor subunit TctC
MSSNTWTTALGHIQGGTVVPIAVTAAKRLPGYDVPTFKEFGHAELVTTTWFSISGPPGLPKEIVERLNREIVKAMQSPEIQKRLLQEGMDFEATDAATFTKFVADEVARWTPMVQASGAKAE